MHYSFRFLLAILAVWRLSHLITQEVGPWNAFRKLRAGLGGTEVGRLFSCFYCLSIWIAMPAAVFVGGSLPEIVVCWLAVSGGAILLERMTREPFEFEVEDADNELLRPGRGKSAGN